MQKGKTLGRQPLLTFDKLTGIVAPGGLLTVEFKSDQHKMSLYSLTDDVIAVVEERHDYLNAHMLRRIPPRPEVT